MDIRWSLSLVLVLLFNYSYSRFIDSWATTDDKELINESLKKVLAHLTQRYGNEDVQSKVTNLVCKTQVLNGINIKLYFELEQQKWKCWLYKSFVETLNLQYEKCVEVQDGDSFESIPKTEPDAEVQQEPPPSHDNEEDDEAKVDELNQNQGEPENNKDAPEISNNNQQDANNGETNPDTPETEPKPNDDGEENNQGDTSNDSTTQNNDQEQQNENANNEKPVPDSNRENAAAEEK